MKVIKRDGRAVDYDREKIEIAIEKANKEVSEKEKAKKIEINEITNYIENLGKKRILVEDIQDIIEQKLMSIQRFELAKKYIVYRYTRQLVRKQNTTDETILGLIRNEDREEADNFNKNKLVVSTQRDYIAAEVSRDLTKRILLPEKIIKAHKDGILYFHNMDYFVQPIINTSIVNIKDMLDNGTVINEEIVESPNNFHEACIIITRIIETIANNQYGEQKIDLSCLGKYLKKSKEKIKEEIEQKYKNKITDEVKKEIIKDETKEELSKGIQIIKYQISTFTKINGQKLDVKIFLNPENSEKYVRENKQIKNELLKQNINITDQTEKSKYLFDQGMVSINLLQIAIVSDKNENQFWKLLKERLEICLEALMCRHYALLGTKANTSPIHWCYGAISRLKETDKINELLKNKSSLSLGYIGLEEALKLMNEGNKFEKSKVIKFLKKTIKEWKAQTGLLFKLVS